MATAIVHGREVEVVDLPSGIRLEDHTSFASPGVSPWHEDWTVMLDGKTIGLVHRVGKDWRGEVYCGKWRRRGGPLRASTSLPHASKEAAASEVERYHRFGEAEQWAPGFGTRFAEQAEK